MKTLIAIAAACIAVPAVAQPQPTTGEPTVAAPAQRGGSPARVNDTRYCVTNEVTGSRLRRKECRTRAQWLAFGYDPLDDLKK